MKIRISAEKMREVFLQKLIDHNATDMEIAEECAAIMTENSINGVYSHGVNRFPRLISYIDKGYINSNARPELVKSMGAFEQWDGQLGMGCTNAKKSMARAIELSKKYGIGCVALRNTNHWMRGGEYGLQAADAGCVAICWSNTMPNMPPWGGAEPRIGNNPFILCVPREGGHIMVDAAMSQFSYGKVEAARLEGKELPVHGGYDKAGNLTKDPAAIEETGRFLPAGYWKGSGISILLDMIVTLLSDGNSVYRVGQLGDDEYGLSQLFIAIDTEKTGGRHELLLTEIMDYAKSSAPADGKTKVRVPNERSNRVREENLQMGIPVDEEVWNTVLKL